MKKYRKNLILALVCFLIVIVLNFFLPRLLPGNPIAYFTGFSEEDMTPAHTGRPSMKRFVKCFFELLTQIIVKVRKCKVQRVCVLHFQLAGSGGCFFLMKLYH